MPGRLLTRERLRYAWLVGAVLWGGWALVLVLGEDRLDLAGHVVGTDYLQFYAAGTTLNLDRGERLYDVPFQYELQRQLIGPQLRERYAYFYPPFFAVPFALLARLPYLASFALWSVLSLGALLASLWLLREPRPARTFAWALTFFPVFASVSFGQNALLSLALLSGVYRLWSAGRRTGAGALASLLLFKPPLLLGVIALWLLGWRRDARTLAGLALGGGLLATASFALLPQESLAYLAFVRGELFQVHAWEHFPLWHLHGPRGFWWLLMPQHRMLADALWIAVALAALVAFARFWRGVHARPPLAFAGAVCLTFATTPHAMIYDWSLLLLPALLLWRHAPELREDWRGLFAAVWVATFVGAQLTVAQLALLPAALQITVPVLLAVCWAGGRRLLGAPGPSAPLAPAAASPP